MTFSPEKQPNGKWRILILRGGTARLHLRQFDTEQECEAHCAKLRWAHNPNASKGGE